MRTAFIVLPFFFAILAMALFVAPGKRGVRFQAVWAAWLLLCASKFLCYAALGGNAFAPELPEKLVWLWNWAYSGMCILLALAAACRLVRFAVSPFVKLPCGGKVWFALLPLLAWSISAKGVYNGIKPPEVVEIEVRSPNLPESLDGYRIVHATDLHASAAARKWRTQAIVDRINAAAPDLVCLTGDYSDGMSAAQKENVAPLAGIKAKDGVVAVTGNHEYYYDTARWMAFYHSIGIDFLSNECVFPRRGLAVAGVDDPVCAMHGFEPPSAAAALSAATNGEFRILLQHRPHVGEPSQGTRCDMQLSGHTHGGVMPLFDRLVAKYNGGMSKGVYSFPERPFVYVSPGAGQWAGFPVRFFDDPVLTLLVLRKGAPE